MIRIRRADLQDYHGVWQVHASDIDEWVTDSGDVDISVFHKTTMAERWQKGGPWMSPETCAIHLNALLLAGHMPLVALKRGQVVGEIELFIGDDARVGGKTANISVLYTHRRNRGQGLGSALLREAIRRAKALGCRYISVFNPSPQAEPLYRRFGMTEVFEQQLLLLPCRDIKPASVTFAGIALPSHDQLAGIPLKIGYYQSSLQCWQQLVWSITPGIYALPLVPISPEMIVRATNHKGEAIICFRPIGSGSQAQVYLWTNSSAEDWIEAVMTWGRRLRFKQLALLCDASVAVTLHKGIGGELSTKQKRLISTLV